METNTWSIGVMVKKVLMALACVVVLGGVAAGPARADDGRDHRHEHGRDHRHDHDRDRDRHWRERHWREAHGRPVYGVYGYAPPTVVYAPPPPPPSVSFVFPIR